MKLHSEHQRFFYRVAGVVVHDGRVLTHKDTQSIVHRDTSWDNP
jgi:hypothetical protein